MKSKYIFILLSICCVTLLYAQNGEISTTLSRITDSGSDWKLDFKVNMNFNPANGLSFQLPAGISVIPVTIQINGREIWLQNKMGIPDRDSVITWNLASRELSLFFRNGLLQGGDALTITCNASIQSVDNSPHTIILKEAFLTDNGINFSDRDYARGTIPFTSNQKEN